MADEGAGQKTEEPTQHKLEQAYRRGEAPVAGEVRHALMFAAMAVILGGFGLSAMTGIGAIAVRLWGGADDFVLDPGGLRSLLAGVMLNGAWALAPVAGLLAAAAVLTGLIQGRAGVSWSRVAPKWSKLSPVAGAGRLFGTRALVEFAKTATKFALVGAVALWIAWPHRIAIDGLIGASPLHLLRAAGTIVFAMVRAVAMLVVALAVADAVYQRGAFLKRMRMTVQEVRDEIKQNDGDPKVKARIRAIGQARSRRRMMSAVPGATVVITNPTHYAVALDYRHGEMAAPVVLAKGADALALRIRAVATEAGVPIVESPPLARALYASAEIHRPIPVEHYTAVAEIIGHVLRLARRADAR